MRYKWGLKKNIPHRKEGDSPKFLVRHLDLVGYMFLYHTMTYDEWASLVKEITMGWHPCITASELVGIIKKIGVKYNIEMDT